MTINQLSSLIAQRRAVAPKFFIPGKAVDKSQIDQILENANWAPTHKRTEPWRFQVFHSEAAKQKLSNFLSEYYQKTTPAELFSEEKKLAAGANPLRAGAAIAVILHPDPAANLPEFEEIASVAIAVQNMWLSATAMGLAGFWATPKALLEDRECLQLQETERCLGLFYLAHHEMPQEITGKRGPIADKVTWR